MKAREFESWEQAFDVCREAGRPMTVAVPLTTLTLEVAKIFPSGKSKLLRRETVFGTAARAPEPVFDDFSKRHPYRRELQACSEAGLLGRTAWFYQQQAITWARHARRGGWILDLAACVSLAKNYLKGYRKIQAMAAAGLVARSEP